MPYHATTRIFVAAGVVPYEWLRGMPHNYSPAAHLLVCNDMQRLLLNRCVYLLACVTYSCRSTTQLTTHECGAATTRHYHARAWLYTHQPANAPTHEPTNPRTQAALPMSHRAVDNAAKAEDAETGEHAEAREVGRHHGGDLLVDHGRDEEPQAHLQAGEKATEASMRRRGGGGGGGGGEFNQRYCRRARAHAMHAAPLSQTPRTHTSDAGVAFEPDLSTKP